MKKVFFAIILFFAFVAWQIAEDEHTPQNAEKKNLIAKETRTEEILAELKKIPVSQYEKNKTLYQELVVLNPGVEKYEQKVKLYSDKIEKLKEKLLEKERKKLAKKGKILKERNNRVSKFGEPPKQNTWDGSYLSVENYLKKIANDPDSLKFIGCTKVYYTDDGWLVGCDYRGRNAFGAMVKNSNWFTIAHNTVIKMHPASAYKP